MRKLVDDCNSSNPCPAVWETQDAEVLLVQGYIVDGETLAKVDPPNGESVVRVPRSLLVEYAQQLIEQGELSEKVPA